MNKNENHAVQETIVSLPAIAEISKTWGAGTRKYFLALRRHSHRKN